MSLLNGSQALLRPMATAPGRRGRFTQLVPMTPKFYDFVYGLSADENVGFRWRFAGSIPAREAFDQLLWNSTLA